MKVFIDLFAGLGGASEAFYHDPSWKVLRIDNNEELLPHCDGLIISDITDYEGTMRIIKALLPATLTKLVVWASPPCLEFSNAYNAPAAEAARAGIPFEPSVDCLHAALDIIEALSPNFWYIENVKGAIQIFSEEIGMKFRQSLGQFYLWGSFPLIPLPGDNRKIRKNDSRWSPLRSNIRAKLPFLYSKYLLTSIDHQTTLQFDED